MNKMTYRHATKTILSIKHMHDVVMKQEKEKETQRQTLNHAEDIDKLEEN